MPVLKFAMNSVEIIAGILAAMALGDSLGYKFGRKSLTMSLLIAFLAVVVIFTIYAGVVLA